MLLQALHLEDFQWGMEWYGVPGVRSASDRLHKAVLALPKLTSLYIANAVYRFELDGDLGQLTNLRHGDSHAQLLCVATQQIQGEKECLMQPPGVGGGGGR